MKTILSLCKESVIQSVEGINILKALDHLYIVRIFKVNQDVKNYYLIIEHCEKGMLFDGLLDVKEFSESKVAVIMK